MKTSRIAGSFVALTLAGLAMVFAPNDSYGQRGGRVGGGGMQARPAGGGAQFSRPQAAPVQFSRPQQAPPMQFSRPQQAAPAQFSRPQQAPAQFSRPQQAPAQYNQRSFEGFRPSEPSRDISRPTPAERPNIERPNIGGERPIMGGERINRENNIGNRNITRPNISNREINRANVIRNNTTVRRNDVNTYVHAPYAWGGHRYYGYHPYAHYGYHPHRWGGVWHPWGYVATGLGVTALAVAIANSDDQYYYDMGTWYSGYDGDYTVVPAPIGADISSLPSDVEIITVNGVTYYYYGGSYYIKTSAGYQVVAPPAGAVVSNIPEGGREVQMGDRTYIQFGDTYYQPIQIDGVYKYEVIQVE